ncbi:MAG: hypothetical protein QM617_03805 [Comamonas sp.]
MSPRTPLHVTLAALAAAAFALPSAHAEDSPAQTTTTASTTATTPAATQPQQNDVARWLDERGIYPSILLRSKLFYSASYGLPSGQHQLENITLLALNLDLDLGKLLNIQGGSFHLETENNFIRRNNAIGSSFGSFPLAQLPPNAPRRDVPVFSYAQRLSDGKADFEIGRKNITWYFLDAFAPWENGSRMETMTWLTAPPPYATWMAQGSVKLGSHGYLKAGLWEYNIQNWGYSGWNFGFDGASGATGLLSAGYREEPNETLYPRRLDLTGYYINADEADPYTGTYHTGNRGLILSAGQVVQRFGKNPTETSQGLYVYGVLGANLEPWNAAGVSNNATVGATWINAFGRTGDSIGVKYTHTRLSRDEWQSLNEANISSGGSGVLYGRNTSFLMLHGAFNVTSYLSVNPFIAYGFKPNTAYNSSSTEKPREGFFMGAVATINIGNLLGLPKFK